MRFHSVSKNYERVCDHCHYVIRHLKKFWWSSTMSQAMTA